MTSYEQKVRKIAEEMARKSWTGATKWDAIHDKEKYIKFEIVNARIAVKHMADELRYGLEKFFPKGIEESVIQEILIERGLIPSPENKEQ